MATDTLTESQRRLLLHAAGWDRYRPHYERDTVLVRPDGRDGGDALALAARGYFKQCGGPTQWCAGDVCFKVTPAGQAAAKRYAQENGYAR